MSGPIAAHAVAVSWMRCTTSPTARFAPPHPTDAGRVGQLGTVHHAARYRRGVVATAPSARGRPVSVGSLTDVAGHSGRSHPATGRGWQTGTTVVIVAERGGRGGRRPRRRTRYPRDRSAARPTNLVDRIHAVCLTGGSAYGLAAADGVMAELEDRRLGVGVGPEPEHVVPVVPTAVVFDLGRGGSFGHRPDASFGAAPDARRTGASACAAARWAPAPAPWPVGCKAASAWPRSRCRVGDRSIRVGSARRRQCGRLADRPAVGSAVAPADGLRRPSRDRSGRARCRDDSPDGRSTPRSASSRPTPSSPGPRWPPGARRPRRHRPRRPAGTSPRGWRHRCSGSQPSRTPLARYAPFAGRVRRARRGVRRRRRRVRRWPASMRC